MIAQWAAEQEGQALSTVEKMPLISLTIQVCSLQHGFSTVGGGIWLSEALPQLVLSSSAPRTGDHPMLVTMLGFCKGVPQVCFLFPPPPPFAVTFNPERISLLLKARSELQEEWHLAAASPGKRGGRKLRFP